MGTVHPHSTHQRASIPACARQYVHAKQQIIVLKKQKVFPAMTSTFTCILQENRKYTDGHMPHRPVQEQ